MASSEASMTCDDWGLMQCVGASAVNRAMFECVIIGSGQFPNLSAHSVLAPGQPSPKELFSWIAFILHFLTVYGQISPVWAILDGLTEPFCFSLKSGWWTLQKLMKYAYKKPKKHLISHHPERTTVKISMLFLCTDVFFFNEILYILFLFYFILFWKFRLTQDLAKSTERSLHPAPTATAQYPYICRMTF